MNRHDKLCVAFCPWMVAGVRSQWENMRRHVVQRSDIDAYLVEIFPYKPHGLLEALPLLPSSIKGNLRAVFCANELFRHPPLDAVWISGREALPYMMTRGLLNGTTMVSTTDGTLALQAQFGQHYRRRSNLGPAWRLRSAIDNFCVRRATAFSAWSQWAADSLRKDYAIDRRQIHVIPPGIDLERWRINPRRYSQVGTVRLLFVGGDFIRKGGDLLLDVFRRRFRDRCDLHLVTTGDVVAEPGVHVHRSFGPNDPELLALYAQCDIFVLPTRADCFSMASLEAMATRLPVVTSAIGGIPEIVEHEQSGYLIPPDDGTALIQSLAALVDDPALRARMGARGRQIVETKFDAAKNTGRLVDLIVESCRTKGSTHVAW